MKPIRVVVADDHPVYREGLCTVLDVSDGMLVAGRASSGEEAVRLVAETRPDVVLMDLRMPGYGGVEATRRISRDHPGVAVVVLTMLDDDESVFAALRAGARGYLHKEADDEDVRRAVLAAARGDAIFGPRVAPRLAGYFTAAEAPAAPPPFPQLTAAELAVLDLIARGLSNPVIARRLSLSPKTVRNRVSLILAKLPARDRADAIVQAREAGLGR